ncbi:MAG: radical SAM protein [Proteobacteria bacterium]|nr:radical SAM protein [Pseudomonadota bacterium]
MDNPAERNHFFRTGRTTKVPLMAHFRTQKSHYIYDAGTNEIVLVPTDFWEASRPRAFGQPGSYLSPGSFSGNGSQRPRVTELLTSDLKTARDSGLFGTKRPRGRSLFLSKKQFAQKTRQHLSQLILCITERCNLRCLYCPYSASYPHQRQHGSRGMSFETARQAVDFFLAHSKKAEHRFISFYGGEPTLNMPIVRKIVEYTRCKCGSSVSFNMTTNGYNLPEETLKFLVDQNFLIVVSVDGPADQHDKYRRTIGQHPTHGGVLKTLVRLRTMAWDDCISRLRLSIVIAPPYDIRRLKLYFDNDPLFQDIGFGVTMVASATKHFFSNQKVQEALEVKLPFDTKFEAMFQEYKQNLINNTPYKSRFLAAIFEMRFLRLHKRILHNGYSDLIYANGICEPGIRRLYVTCDGRFTICEKANNTLEIGNLEEGIDSEKVFGILTGFIRNLDRQCTRCFANRLCSVCFASDFSSKDFYPGDLESECARIREDLNTNLIAYCQVLESNPRAFDFMQDITLE